MNPDTLLDEISELRKRIYRLEASMRRFVQYEVPDTESRWEMKALLDGPAIPCVPADPDHNTSTPDCWCNPTVETMENGAKVIIHKNVTPEAARSASSTSDTTQ